MFIEVKQRPVYLVDRIYHFALSDPETPDGESRRMSAVERTGGTARPDSISGQLASELTRFALVGALASCTHYVIALLSAAISHCTAPTLWATWPRSPFPISATSGIPSGWPPGNISHSSQLPRFVLGSLSGLALSYLLLALARQVLDAPNWLAAGAGGGFGTGVRLPFNKRFVFRSAANQRGQESLTLLRKTVSIVALTAFIAACSGSDEGNIGRLGRLGQDDLKDIFAELHEQLPSWLRMSSAAALRSLKVRR